MGGNTAENTKEDEGPSISPVSTEEEDGDECSRSSADESWDPNKDSERNAHVHERAMSSPAIISDGGPRSSVNSSQTQQLQAPKEQESPQRPRSGSVHVRIEEKIGVCLEEFRCQHNNFTGILYVGPLGVVFLGKFLLFEWTVDLKWCEVTKVGRKVSNPTYYATSASENTVIRIETAKKADKATGVYEFDGFFDSEKALENLIGLHNDSILGRKNGKPVISPRMSSAIPLRRSNSDPPDKISNLFNFDDPPLGVQTPTALAHQSTCNKATMEDLRNQCPDSKVANSKIFVTKHQGVEIVRRKTIHKAALRSASTSSVDAPERQVIRRSILATPTNGNGWQENGLSNHSKTSEKVIPLTEEQIEAEWNKKCGEFQEIPEHPVQDREFSLSGDDQDGLDAFLSIFVENDAPFSWSKFMTEIVGDLDVQATDWEPKASDEKKENEVGQVESLTRNIVYTHPVNAPMAPPTAKARKEQTLTVYGPQHGLVLETKTVVSDVPMTDCFYVRDVLQVRKKSNKWILNIRFEVVFIKSTYFRALIARTTNGEFQKFMTDLAEYLNKNCGSKSGTEVAPAAEEVSPPPPPISPPPQVSPKTTKSIGLSILESLGSLSLGEVGNGYWKILMVFMLLWMARIQVGIYHETRLLRSELQVWNAALVSELGALREIQATATASPVSAASLECPEMKTSTAV